MKNFYRIAILLLTVLPSLVAAQQTSLRIVLCDAASRQPVAGATVGIKTAGSSTIQHSATTSQQGVFTFSGLSNGPYVLQVHSLGYPDTLYRFTFPSVPDTLLLSHGGGMQLKGITVQDNTPPVRMKGDTIEYNANKYKTKENAVVEDLLRKLPGVKVERDGSIKSQGETVQRILVDGKEFFGSDPSVATRNLPADMIDKVQVLDKKSDMSEFTGVADGQQQKTINLVTKKNRKRGYFGNASAGAGTSDRYEGGVNINSFRNDMQLSLLAKGNNVNKSGFSATELIRLASQNRELFNNLPPAALSELMRMKGVKVQGSAEALAEIARPVGYTDTRFGGVNFNNDWGNRLKWRSSYFINDNHTRNDYDYARQYRYADTAYNYLQTGNTDNRSTNHRIDLSADIALSDRTSVKISPRLNATTSGSSESRQFRSYSADGIHLLNEGRQTTRNNNDNQFLTTDILLRHRLRKPGRTLAVNILPEYYRNKGLLLNKNTSNFYNLPEGQRTVVTDQQTTNNTNVYSIKGNIVYTEPLSKKHSLQIGQQLFYSDGDYDRKVSNRNTDGHFSEPDPILSDRLFSTKLQYTGKVSLAGNYKNFTYTAGAGWQQSSIRGHSGLKGYQVDGRYHALLPDAYAEWKTSKTSRFIFRYAMEANTPGVTSLQPLDDNSDPLYVRRGNPLLEQEKSQRWSLSYNTFDLVKSNNTYVNGSFIWYNSAITDSTSIDLSSGKQLTIPVNVKGNYNASLSAGKSFNIDNNGSSVSAGISFSGTRNTVFNNGEPNRNLTVAITPDASLTYYLGNNISFTAKGSAAYNIRRFSGISLLPEKNWLLTYGLETTVILPFKMTLETNADGFSALGMASGYNNNILLLNAALSKEIGKHFSLRAEAWDLLNKNESINRITGNGYIEDRKNNALGRYFLLSAIYKFRHFPKPKK